jgi:lysophospholipase L1-like esterase
LCFIELSARLLTSFNILHYFKPFISQVSEDTEDWRWTHTYDDENFEIDAKLFWKPKLSHFPFDERGAVVSEQFVCYRTSEDTEKILVYGDSNTQGLATNSWPNDLQLRLLEHRLPIEVINRGVAGYTSFQGLEKLKQDLKVYKPKVIFFSFGWNDAAPSMSAPDPYVHTTFSEKNILLESRAYLTAVFYGDKLRQNLFQKEKKQPQLSRVPLHLYSKHINDVSQIAEKYNAEVIFLTRPHQVSEAELMTYEGWRNTVPNYNEVIRSLSEEEYHWKDIQKDFSLNPELFIDETHFTPEGHRRASEVLLNYLIKNKML